MGISACAYFAKPKSDAKWLRQRSRWRTRMSFARTTLPIIGAAALGLTIGASGLAIAEFGMSGPGSQLGMPQYMRAESKAVAELGDHEGVYVDKGTFKLHLGKPKANPSADALGKGAHEVTNGAIIYRSGGKLYLVDGTPDHE
jgi:hypothetical protein